MLTAEEAKAQAIKGYEIDWSLTPNDPQELYDFCLKDIQKQAALK